MQSTVSHPSSLIPGVNHAPANRELPPGFETFYRPLHARFTPLQQALAMKRTAALARSIEGDKPKHLAPSEATEGKWTIELPAWVHDQRNQMTGPADDAELVVKLLNSGAPGVMLCFEDAMANTWENVMLGMRNTVAALHGTLTYDDKKRGKTVGINAGSTVVWTRPRGLHMSQGGVFPELTSASAFDVALLVFSLDPAKIKHPICIYIPKSESADEALWWNEFFAALEKAKGLPPKSIKAMALVEAHPMAYELEEFVYNMRDYIVGLNLGRWDYMASLAHFNLTDPKWVLPDRNTIPSDVAFFQNLRELIPLICHKRGILAIGGMTALFPSRENPELNARALDGLEKDKANEAKAGMDGAWTGHPDQNAIAVAQFPFPNQIHAERAPTPRYPDLRPLPAGVGTMTVAGTRAAVKTVIRYREGVLAGRGATLLDGYMEDLATDRIYRVMIAQRIRHRDAITIVDDSGAAIKHTPEFVSALFDEELAKLIADGPQAGADAERLRKARLISEAMITEQAFDPI